MSLLFPAARDGCATPGEAGPGGRAYGVAVAVFVLAPVIGYLAPLGLWAPWAVLFVAMAGEDILIRQTSFAGRYLRAVTFPMAWFLLIPALGLAAAPLSLLPALSAGRSLGLGVQILTALTVVPWLWRLPLPRRRWLVALGGLSATAMGTLMVTDVTIGAQIAAMLHGHSPYVLGGGSASRGAVFHAMLLFPACAALWLLKCRWSACVLLGVGLAVIRFNTSDTAFWGTVAGTLAGGMLALAPRLIRLLVPMAILVVLIMPAAVPLLYQTAYCETIIHAPSVAHRLIIWQTVRGLIAQRPVLGWGVDSARVAPGGKDRLYLRACDAADTPAGKVEMIGEALPLHPHNGAMDLWYSLGGVGVLAGCWALWRGFGAAIRRWPGRVGAATLGATSCVILIIAFMGYGLWQSWFDAAICLGLSALALLPGHPGDGPVQCHGRLLRPTPANQDHADD